MKSLKSLQAQLPFEVSGNEKSDQLVVFVHGYPDTVDLYSKITPQVDPNALTVNVSYPNYSEKASSFFGFSQSEVAKRLAIVIAGFQTEKKREVTLVAHDWGAIIAYIFEKQNPNVLKQLIAIDIAPWLDRSPKVMKMLLPYQLKLALAYIIGFFLPFLGNFITRNIIKGYFLYEPPHFKRITFKWNCFYFFSFVNIFKAIISPKNSWLFKYTPSVPVVFIYGAKKPFPFHSEKWVKWLKETKGCEYISVEDSNHWVPVNDPNLVAAAINRRIKK